MCSHRRICCSLLLWSFVAEVVGGGGPVATPNSTGDDDDALDVTLFETEVLPRWLRLFQLQGAGNFSYLPHTPQPHPYATSDVAHVLCFVSQLDSSLSPSDRDAYAARINQWQQADGFYDPGDPPGGSLWHAAGYVPAGLHLVGRDPLRRNELFDRIAATPALWEPTVAALLDADAQLPPANISAGCSDGYSCGQNVASLLAWQIITNGSAAIGGGMDR
jgi:hypothetical protein